MTRAILIPLALLLLGASFAGPGVSQFGPLDYRVPWVSRAMQTGTVCSVTAGCPSPPCWGVSQQTTANKAIFVDLGTENAVSTVLNEAGAALLPSTDTNGAVTSEDPDCWPAGTGTAGGYTTYEGARNWVASVNALRRSGGAPIKALLWYRFDEVAYPFLAMPGFQKEFLVDTARPWSEVTAFFSTNSDYPCTAMAGGYGCTGACAETCDVVPGDPVEPCNHADNLAAGRCGYNFCYASYKVERVHTSTTQECQRPDVYLDALPGANATEYQTKVHYFPHQSGIVTEDEYAKRFPYAIGYLTDLGNTSYQAWQVARLTALWNQVKPWAHSFMLTYKGSMHMCREPANSDDAHSKAYHVVEEWIGGDGDRKCQGWDTDHYSGSATTTQSHATHNAYILGGGTPWSAQPTDFKWTDFIQGWAAITAGMRAAGVPYSLIWSELTPWWQTNSNWNPQEDAGVCTTAARCLCDYSAATGSARSDGWQLGDGTDNCEFNDDPSTHINENALVIEILRGAKLVLIGGSNMNGYSMTALPAVKADLESHGVQVIIAPAGVSNFTDYAPRPIP